MKKKHTKTKEKEKVGSVLVFLSSIFFGLPSLSADGLSIGMRLAQSNGKRLAKSVLNPQGSSSN